MKQDSDEKPVNKVKSTSLLLIIFVFIIVILVIIIGFIFVVSILRLREGNLLRLPTEEESRKQIEQFGQRDFGITPNERFKAVEKNDPKLIGIIQTRFPPTLRFEARLFLVNSGKAVQIARSSSTERQAGRKSFADLMRKSIAMPLFLYDYDITLEDDEAPLRISAIRAYGTRQGGGGIGGEYKPFKYETEQTFTGDMQFDQDYLVYVRGDSEFKANRDMNIDEFVKANTGKFIVVTVKLVSR